MGRIAFQESAGGVVVDKGRVLLIRTRTRSGRAVWTFPKGRIERGERFWEAALREVREETGYLCRLKRRLSATRYVFHSDTTQIRKTVHWFLAEPLRKAGQPNPREVDEVGWLTFEDAFEKLAYRSDQGLLMSVVDALSENVKRKT
ncbi:MAG TPA: NUDIX hydrolase [Rhodothermales bacterium]|nr:NUDIX hydrolase [Rhodothermales bacterium]